MLCHYNDIIIPNVKSSITYNNEKIMLLNYDNLGLYRMK